MDMNIKRIIIMTMVSVMVCISPAITIKASMGVSNEVPYQTYTYDKWGNSTPAPNGYIPQKLIIGQDIGISDFSEPQDMFYHSDREEVYIVDTGNKRIVITDKKFNLIHILETLTLDGREYYLERPTGIFVNQEGILYIADQEKGELIVCNREGVILDKFGKPDSNLIEENLVYKPSKVVVDKDGKIYIQAFGVYQGLIYLKAEGTFVKYFGANKVEMTAKRIFQKMWKNILSDKASSNMQSFNPIEYGNVFLNSDGFIYATAAASENNSRLIVKLNPLGVDINHLRKPVWYSNATFTDITSDEEDNITVIDGKTGRIYQSDKNGQLMFAFGGIGNQVGLFKLPTAIIEIEDELYVLDADKKSITQFTLTSFGATVRKAIRLYNSGLYEESIEPWEDVIRLNANYLLAYTGLGKAYYQLNEFDTSMKYYKLANDRGNYSTAYKEFSLIIMRENFGLAIGTVILIIVMYKVIRRYLINRRKVRGVKE